MRKVLSWLDMKYLQFKQVLLGKPMIMNIGFKRIEGGIQISKQQRLLLSNCKILYNKEDFEIVEE